MSVIHVNHIKNTLLTQFEGLIGLGDWEGHSPEQQQPVLLTRALAAYALTRLAEVSPAEAALAVTDGGEDNGLDAVFLDREEHRIILVQSKWDAKGEGSPSVAAVQKLLQGFDDLVNGRFDRFNAKIRDREEEIFAALGDAKFRFLLVFVHTGQQEISEHARRAFEDALDRFNHPSELVDYLVINQAGVHAFVADEASGESIDLDMSLFEWGLKSDPQKSYYGQVVASDIADWYEEYGNQLFNKNIRKFITDSEINDAIVGTLLGDPSRFWYFNNGITVLCSSISKKPFGGDDRGTGQFACEGVSVVNGAQTVGSIGVASRSEGSRLSDARVLVRLISLEEAPEVFASEITRATNTQNRVGRRDFVSLDPLQERLRRELQLENGKLYAFKTGEPEPEPEDGCTLAEATVALACADSDVSLTVLAKREVSRLWEDTSRAPYRRIFNDGLNALRLWRSVRIMRRVAEELKRQEAELDDNRSRLIVTHGNRFILHVVFQKIGTASLGDLSCDMESILAEAAHQAREVAVNVVGLVDANYSGNYPGSLFKNEAIYRALLEMLEGVSAEGRSDSATVATAEAQPGDTPTLFDPE